MNLETKKIIKTTQKKFLKEKKNQELKEMMKEHKRFKKILFLSCEINNKEIQNLIIDKLDNLDKKINDLLLEIKLI